MATYPRWYFTKRLLWKALRMDSVPTTASSWSDLRERLGRLVYQKLDNGYSSQGGQDQYLDQIVFRGRTNGVFAEIGANDGIQFSNTAYFEKRREWTGVCVEPNPSVFARLRENRDCLCIQACAGATPGEVEFPIIEDATGSLYGSTAKTSVAGSVLVQRKTLNKIFTDAHVTDIDYLSIDIEGGELGVFQALELNRFRVKVVSLEENESGLQMDRAMFALGYRFMAKVFTDRIYSRVTENSDRF